MSCMACEGGSKMRMFSSCNGCRALRKGCSPDCTIRPCLEWIKTPEAQANATAFLAKFYGRAGLLNLIAAAPGGDDAKNRQAVFRSLIYEACCRIVNPVYGAVGLLWSGQWEKCVDAVQAMFRGELGVPVVDDAVQAADAASSEANAAPPPLAARLGPSAAAYDIRHKGPDAAAAADLLRFARVGRAREGFKRAAGSLSSSSSNAKLPKGGKGKARGIAKILKGMSSNNVGSLGSKLNGSKENTDVEAAASHLIQGFQAEAEPPVGSQVVAADQEAEEEVGLELTLG